MDGNEDQTAKRFSMRIQLRPKTAVEAEPVKKKAKTGAERARLFRERRAADSVRQAEYLQVERERSRQRRTNMSDEQRKLYNASAALRNAKSRAKKRQQKTNSTPQSTPTRRSSRLDGKDLKTKREKERQRVQKYRDNMTPQKRRRVNEKRMRRYYAVKERRVVEKAAQQQASRSITEGPKTTKRSDKLKVNLKEDILSGGSKVLSVLRMILQGKGEAKQRLEEFGLTYADDKPLLTALEKTKKKRDVDTLKMRGFIARTVKNVKKKYYQLGFDSRTIKKSREKLSLYKKESKFKPVISKFFEDHSVHLPGMKTVSKKSLSQKKILQSPVTELFKEFRNENPACRVSLKTFFRHRPKHVLSCTKTPLEQCKCEICLNPSLKLRAFNKLTGQQLQLKDLMDKTLCPSTNKFHKLGCLQRSCINCDPSAAFEVLSQEYDVTKFITWEKWDYVSTDNKKHLEKLERQGSLNDLICELCKELKTLPQHIFTYRWQAEQYKLLKALPPKDCAVCTFDFAQNYVCTSQDQPQSSFYGMKQITVHPVVIHRQCPVECGGIITDNIVFFSDDLKHDPYFVQDVTTTIVRFLKKVGVTRAFVFSDGASSQYKAKLPFSLITSIQGFKIERHFFGSRHGKSACDALGGVIKTAARQAVATRSVTIGNAKELFEFCRGSLSIQVESCCGSNRSFHLVTAIARPKSDGSTLKTVPGTRKIHSLIPLAPNVIATRNLSCFCQHCLAEDYVNCVNADYVSSWDKIKLSNASPNVFEALGEISERDSFFMEAQKIMCSCSNFQELQRAALKVSELMAQFSLNKSPGLTVCSVKCRVDKVALGLRPSHVPQNSVPLVTVGDGNCMPRSLCLVYSGSDEWHRELRCRMAIELALNEEFYLSEDSLSEGDSDLNGTKLLDVICKLSDAIVADSENEIDITATFRAEVMAMVHPGIYMGMWQLMAAANVLQCTVVSVYPNQGWPIFQKLHNRIIRPRNGKVTDYLSVMWSSLRDDMSNKHWVANHIVPLLPMNDPDILVDVEDHSTFRNLWDEFEI